MADIDAEAVFGGFQQGTGNECACQRVQQGDVAVRHKAVEQEQEHCVAQHVADKVQAA